MRENRDQGSMGRLSEVAKGALLKAGCSQKDADRIVDAAVSYFKLAVVP